MRKEKFETCIEICKSKESREEENARIFADKSYLITDIQLINPNVLRFIKKSYTYFKHCDLLVCIVFYNSLPIQRSHVRLYLCSLS